MYNVAAACFLAHHIINQMSLMNKLMLAAEHVVIFGSEDSLQS